MQKVAPKEDHEYVVTSKDVVASADHAAVVSDAADHVVVRMERE